MEKFAAEYGSRGQRYDLLKNYVGLLSLLALLGLMVFFLGGCALVTKAQQGSALNQLKTYSVGETFRLGDFEYKVNSIRTTDGNYYKVRQPRDGNTFLLVGLTIENHGRSAAEIRSMVGFNLKDQEGRKPEFSMGAVLAANQELDGTIPAGGKISGELGYEVLKGAQTYKLAVIPDPLNPKTTMATVDIPIQ